MSTIPCPHHEGPAPSCVLCRGTGVYELPPRDEKTVEERAALLFAEARADGYEAAFRAGVWAVCLTALRRGNGKPLSAAATLDGQSALGVLLSGVDTADIPYLRRAELRHHALTTWWETLESLKGGQ